MWPQTELGKIANMPCRKAGNQFLIGPKAQRPCLESGHWGEVEMTACTVADGVKPFLLAWALTLTDGTEIAARTQDMLKNKVSI